MRQLSFKRHRFPADIIRHSVWLYARFTLSYRDVEEMLAERGLDVSYETVRRWFLKFGSTIAANLCRARPCPYRKLNPDQGMMQTAEVRNELDPAVSSDRPREWSVFA